MPTVPEAGGPELIVNTVAAVTPIELTPLIEAEVVSVAVRVCVPAVSSVAEKFPVPAARAESAGSFAWASLLVKCTVPEYPAETLLAASSALTVTLKVALVFVEPGPFMARCVAVLLTTLIALDVAFNEAVTVSVAVMVCEPIDLNVTVKFPVRFVKGEFAGSTACASVLVKCRVPA
jgi:hypothetical protein